MTTPQKCPKCSGVMEEGFVLDSSYAATVQPKWMEGRAEKSVWTGVKMGGRAKHPVTTFRCAKCGYLESYALET